MKGEPNEQQRRWAQLDIGPPLALYDGLGEFAWIGKLHAKMLANLLGRFLPLDARRNDVVRKRIGHYPARDINRHPVTFYIGNTYGNPLPQAFKDVVMSSQKNVVWINYNLQQIAWTDDGSAWNPAFTDRFGFAFLHNGSSRIPSYETSTGRSSSLRTSVP
jgi:hypothetical protein